jgi:hypothetical protein
LVDIDGDGRPDLLSGSYAARVYLWRGREGGGFGAREDLVVLSDESFRNGHVACHAVDWDGDGDLDLLLGARNGNVELAANTGDAKKAAFAAPALLASGVTEARPQPRDAGPHAADWDGDGDLDLLVGYAAGDVTLFRNAGTRKAPKLEAATELLPPRGGRIVEERCRTAEMCAARAKPWVVDWNRDGRPDLLVGDFHDHRGGFAGDMGNEQMHGWVWLYIRRERP